jgi:hypothetical protein
MTTYVIHEVVVIIQSAVLAAYYNDVSSERCLMMLEVEGLVITAELPAATHTASQQRRSTVSCRSTNDD